jgi:N,N'-diacetylchitobiose transport system permease protein
MSSTLTGRRAPKLWWNVLGLLVFVTAGFPLYWMLNTAFKPAEDAIDPDPSLLPTGITFANFGRALDIADFWGPVGRSMVVSLAVVVIGMVVGLRPRSPSPASPSAAARS